jgi:hypothetical protein
MFGFMKCKTIALTAALIAAGLGLNSCADEPEKKPVGPVSETSKIPWNSPVAGQGQGQFGMMPQNQYRR